MAEYRLYCIDGDGKIASAEWVQATSDDEAVAIVRIKKAGRVCEIWDRQRLVAKIEPRPTKSSGG